MSQLHLDLPGEKQALREIEMNASLLAVITTHEVAIHLRVGPADRELQSLRLF